jgi:DNA-binding PadR family transcriptional regulator
MEEELKKEILEFLKDKEKSSTEIYHEFSRKNYYTILKILEEMEQEKLITKIEVGNFTFWKVREKSK